MCMLEIPTLRDRDTRITSSKSALSYIERPCLSLKKKERKKRNSANPPGIKITEKLIWKKKKKTLERWYSG